MLYPKKILFLSFFVLLSLTGCASKDYYTSKSNVNTEVNFDDYQDEADFDDYAETSITESEESSLDGFNRAMHSVNDFVLLGVVKPVHQGYSYIVPKRMRSGFSNLSNHLLAPVRFINALLQLDFGAASVEVGHFIVNSITSLGLADVAATKENYFYYNKEALDLGVTFAYWGFAEGPVVVLPFFGPRNIRDTFGLVGDIALDPVSYFTPIAVTFANAGLTFNDMDKVYIPYKSFTKSAIDPYIALKEGMQAYRFNLVANHLMHLENN